MQLKMEDSTLFTCEQWEAGKIDRMDFTLFRADENTDVDVIQIRKVALEEKEQLFMFLGQKKRSRGSHSRGSLINRFSG